MTPSYEVRDSSVHGKGIFAAADIKTGDIIGSPLKVNYFVFIDISPDLGKWINHSWYPNAQLVKQEHQNVWDLVALSPIKKKDEITMDYRDTPWFIAKPSIWYK